MRPKSVTDILLILIIVLLAIIALLGNPGLGQKITSTGQEAKKVANAEMETQDYSTANKPAGNVPTIVVITPFPTKGPLTAFGSLEAPVKVKAELIKLDPVTEIIAGVDFVPGQEQTMIETDEGIGYLTTMPEGSNVPMCSEPLKPPCETGQFFRMTQGYDFSAGHLGTDTYCSNSEGNWDPLNTNVVFPSDMVVMSMVEYYVDNHTSGKNIVGACKYPDGSELHVGYGHLKPSGQDGFTAPPKPGDIIESGVPFAKIGTTGNSQGQHIHFYMVLCSNGTCGFVNPHTYPSIWGKR